MNGARLVLGAVQWGGPYGIANRSGPPDDAELTALLAAAAAAGVRAIDTARSYGESEVRIGRLGAPARFAVGTKLAPDLDTGAPSPGEARARAAESLAASRRALGVTRLDTVLLHRAAHRHAAGGAIWELLRAERAAGGIGCLGISAASPEQAEAALADPEVERIQVAASLLDQRLERAGFFARAQAAGKAVDVRSVFLQGVAHLAPAALPPHLAPLAPLLAALEARARDLGLRGLAEACLLYAAALPGVRLVLGFERTDQLTAALASWRRGPLRARRASGADRRVPPLDPALLDPARWPPATRAAWSP